MKVRHSQYGWSSLSPLFPSVPSLQAGKIIYQAIKGSRIFTNIIVKSTTRQCRFHHPLRKSLHDYFIGIENLRADVCFILPFPNIIEARAENRIRRIKTVTSSTGVFLDQFRSRE